MNRTSIAIVGESGAGLVSTGKALCSALRDKGYYLIADREYPSLIKGGCSTFTVNFSDQPVLAVQESVDVMVSLTSHAIEKYFNRIRNGGVWVHVYERNHGLAHLYEEAEKRGIHIVHLNGRTLIDELGGIYIMQNVLLMGMLWKVLGFAYEEIRAEIEQQFSKKPHLLSKNLECLAAGYQKVSVANWDLGIPMVGSSTKKMLLDGNHAIALGAVKAGVRAYYAYPMSPSSSILTHMAQYAARTGILVKQAEDEITVANLTLGSYFAGTRAMCATSGGGFDLMTETVSLAGILEQPWVCAVVQRPGPATGLPTWTGQGDLDLAIYSAHGEYAKIVLACSDVVSAYELTQHAHNLAEKYRVPVILLSEKNVAESIVTVESLSDDILIERHLVDPKKTSVVSSDYFKIDGANVSPRWVPCSDAEAYYFANGDEHDEMGRLTEEAELAGPMYAKRVDKLELIRDEIFAPRLIGDEQADISFIGWGSSRMVLLDVIDLALKRFGVSVNYLHFDCVWPLRTVELQSFLEKNNNVHLIEGNRNGQLGRLIESAMKQDVFSGRLLKWDGRSFSLDEVLQYIEAHRL